MVPTLWPSKNRQKNRKNRCQNCRSHYSKKNYELIPRSDTIFYIQPHIHCNNSISSPFSKKEADVVRNSLLVSGL